MKERYTGKSVFLRGVLFFVFLLGAGIVLPGAVPTQAASEKAAIKEEIARHLSGKNVVKKIYYADYDRNGRNEAFVLAGPKKAGKLWDVPYTLWFAYMQDGTVIAKKIRKDIIIDSKKLNLKSADLFCAVTYCTTSLPTDLYEVRGNEIVIIFQGECISGAGGDSFSSVHSTYDCAYDSSVKGKLGHSWKPYYFYYQDGKVKEYKGKKISLKKFKKYKNAAKMLKKYKKMGKIKSIIYRSNGMVHVNYRDKSKVEKNGYYCIQYTNVTFRLSGNKLIKPVVDDGTYRKKLK